MAEHPAMRNSQRVSEGGMRLRLSRPTALQGRHSDDCKRLCSTVWKVAGGAAAHSAMWSNRRISKGGRRLRLSRHTALRLFFDPVSLNGY